MDLYQKSAEQGFSVAVFNLGVMAENGVGMPADDAQAVELYRAAAGAGLAAAQYNLGVMMAEGRGTEQDIDGARSLFAQAAAMGHELAKLNLERLDSADGVDLETVKRPESGGIGPQ